MTSVELVTILLIAVMCIWVIRAQTTYPIEVAYWEAADAMAYYGGQTEGTVAPPTAPLALQTSE